MRRNCNLELGLSLPSYDFGHRHRYRHHHHHNHGMIEEANESPIEEEHHHHRQQLTIFYDGKICVSDVTELQAKSILTLANKNVEEKAVTVRTASGSEPSSPKLQSHHQIYSPGTGLSMKRSLQRFLQKRKTRIQEAFPYHH